MKHYVGYLNNPNRRVEVDAVNYIAAQHQAAILLGTRRERDIYLIECTQPSSIADLIADTEEEETQ
jgi:hypothetical protein